MEMWVDAEGDSEEFGNLSEENKGRLSFDQKFREIVIDFSSEQQKGIRSERMGNPMKSSKE